MKELHERLWWGVVAFLFLAPVPLASNRPFFWSLNGVIVGLGGLFYLLAGSGTRARARMPLRRLAAPTVFIGIAVAWMVVQLLPLPEVIGTSAWVQSSATSGEALPTQISVDPAATLGMLIRYLSYAVFFFLVVQITVNQTRARRLLEAIFWIAVAHGAYGIIALLAFGDPMLFMPKWAYEGYATGFFVNRSHFAAFLGMGMVCGAALLLDALGYGVAASRGRTRRPADFLLGDGGLYATGLLVLASGIVLSGSRMGAGATATGIFVVFLLMLARSPGRRAGLAGWLALAMAVGTGVLFFSGGRLLDRLGSVESSADERLLLYRQVWDMILDRPLTGYGAGTFGDAFQVYHRLPLSADVAWTAAHNLYLELLTDLGIFGVLPVLACAWLFLVVLRAAFGNKRLPVLAAAAGSSVLVAMHSLVDFPMQIEADVFLYLALLAAGFAQARAPSPTRRQSTAEAADQVERIGLVNHPG